MDTNDASRNNVVGPAVELRIKFSKKIQTLLNFDGVTCSYF